MEALFVLSGHKYSGCSFCARKFWSAHAQLLEGHAKGWGVGSYTHVEINFDFAHIAIEIGSQSPRSPSLDLLLIATGSNVPGKEAIVRLFAANRLFA